ncbi:hypothetical protein SAMN02745857_04325 [Andreprevotia lacus DSM 23236]|jgi:phage-related protein|uniref:Uncharacterized protein n=1 Tax=Andreprevotia lacus DSM 23236 TaxID=1121001 RepID=A0A1W1Y2F8_9NEIS|nr:hypothetical protein [Andreprevotia lacus]SMC29981.1 hypothetical protein SAMN02745857_04325 [Andreprevotia lacus DSM 23236]
MSIISKIKDYIVEFGQFITDTIMSIAQAFKDLLYDAMLSIFSALMDMIIALVNSIQVPEFILKGISSLIAQLPQSLQFFLSVCGFAEAFSILGIGVGVHLIRKFVTLFQW